MSAAQPGKHPLVAMAEGWKAHFGKKKKKKPQVNGSGMTQLTSPVTDDRNGTVLGS